MYSIFFSKLNAHTAKWVGNVNWAWNHIDDIQYFQCCHWLLCSLFFLQFFVVVLFLLLRFPTHIILHVLQIIEVQLCVGAAHNFVNNQQHSMKPEMMIIFYNLIVACYLNEKRILDDSIILTSDTIINNLIHLFFYFLFFLSFVESIRLEYLQRWTDLDWTRRTYYIHQYHIQMLQMIQVN